MARKSKRRSKSESAVPAQVETGYSNELAVVLGPVGVPNYGKNFISTNTHNTPQLIFRVMEPTFQYGWSEGTVSDQDYDAALTLVSTPETTPVALNPITPAAEAFHEEVYPLINALLQSGAAQVRPVEESNVIRTFALTQSLLARIMPIISLNYLANRFDWSLIAPNTPGIPSVVWDIVDVMSASDTDVNDIWSPLISRLSEKVLPAAMVASIQDMYMPYLDDVFGHSVKLNVPSEFYSALSSYDVLTYINAIKQDLSYLEDELQATHNILSTFIPYRVGPLYVQFKGYLPEYEDIGYNNALYAHDNFGDTGDPAWSVTNTVGTGSANGNTLPFFHLGYRPTGLSLINTTIFDVTEDVVDNTYINLSSVLSWNAFIVDDQMNVLLYTGLQSTDNAIKRNRRYISSRYNFVNDTLALANGVGKPGMMVSMVSRFEIIRLNKEFLKEQMNLDAFRRVLALTAGSSGRAIFQSIADAWKGIR
jgi:hypothetical protein